MNPANITLCEQSQSQVATYCVIFLYEMSRIGKSIGIKSSLAVPRTGGDGLGGHGNDCYWIKGFF